MTHLAYGYDLALLSGALVEVTLDDLARVTDIHVLFNVKKVRARERRQEKPAIGRGKSTGRSSLGAKQLTPETVAAQVRDRLYELVLVPQAPVGIDWDLRDSYWGNRRHSGLKAFLAGYVYAFCHMRTLVPMFLTPEMLRAYYDLGSNAHKAQVQEVFRKETVLRPKAALQWTKLNEDERDAVILGVVAHHYSLARRPTHVR